jgi:hypothetical protein
MSVPTAAEVLIVLDRVELCRAAYFVFYAAQEVEIPNLLKSVFLHTSAPKFAAACPHELVGSGFKRHHWLIFDGHLPFWRADIPFYTAVKAVTAHTSVSCSDKGLGYLV